MEKQAILLNSGGKDTLACALFLKQQGFELLSLHIDADSKPHVLAAAKAIADAECVEHEILQIRSLVDSRPYTHEAIGDPSGALLGQRSVIPLLAMMHGLRHGVHVVASGHTPGGNAEKDAILVKALNDYAFATNREEWNDPTEFIYPLLGFKYPRYEIYHLIKNHPLWIEKKLVTCAFSDPPCGHCKKCAARAKFIAQIKSGAWERPQ